MVHDAKMEAEKNASDTRQSNGRDQAQLVTLNRSKPKYIRIERKVVLNTIRMTPVSDSTEAKGQLKVAPDKNVANIMGV